MPYTEEIHDMIRSVDRETGYSQQLIGQELRESATAPSDDDLQFFANRLIADVLPAALCKYQEQHSIELPVVKLAEALRRAVSQELMTLRIQKYNLGFIPHDDVPF